MKLSCLFILLFFSFHILAQDLPVGTRQQLEQLAEASEGEPEDDALLLQLATWRRRPLHINSADADDLRLFPFLSPLQIHHFLAYRKALGPLADVHELQSIPAWDVETIRAILPYITVTQPASVALHLKKRLKGGEQYMLLRNSWVAQKAKGFGKEADFAGDRNHLLVRYRYQHAEGLQYGLTAEKDAGEQMAFKRPADFLSAHFFARKLGNVKALALGDFTVNMGQGLVHWQSLAFGKSAEALAIKRQSPVLRPYTSAGEALFLRGAGITVQRNRLEVSLFSAAQKIAANLDADSAGNKIITSFNVSGLHRTASEQADRKAAGQWAAGAAIIYRKNNGHFGLNMVRHAFSLPIQKQNEPYNLYAPLGKSFLNTSADYGFTLRNLHFFGELAADKAGRGAWVQGLLLSAHPKVDMALHVRAIHRGYTAIAANAFTEGSATANEQGIYVGTQLRPLPRWTINAYADIFHSTWLRFRADGPTSGKDYLVQAQYRPNKTAVFYMRFRSEQKEENETETTAALRKLVIKSRQSLRLYALYPLDEKLNLRSQAENVWYCKGSEKELGWLLFADAQWRPQQKWSTDFRLAFFKTGSYNSRIYAYESDVQFAFSVPALWGEGWRTYALVRYRPHSRLSFWLRVGHSFYSDRDVIGSGLDEIKGNKKTELRFQGMVEW